MRRNRTLAQRNETTRLEARRGEDIDCPAKHAPRNEKCRRVSYREVSCPCRVTTSLSSGSPVAASPLVFVPLLVRLLIPTRPGEVLLGLLQCLVVVAAHHLHKVNARGGGALERGVVNLDRGTGKWGMCVYGHTCVDVDGWVSI